LIVLRVVASTDMSNVTPVIRFVLIPAMPEQKGIREMLEAEAVAEVRRALNAWAYGPQNDDLGGEGVTHPEWAEEA